MDTHNESAIYKLVIQSVLVFLKWKLQGALKEVRFELTSEGQKSGLWDEGRQVREHQCQDSKQKYVELKEAIVSGKFRVAEKEVGGKGHALPSGLGVSQRSLHCSLVNSQFMLHVREQNDLKTNKQKPNLFFFYSQNFPISSERLERQQPPQRRNCWMHVPENQTTPWSPHCSPKPRLTYPFQTRTSQVQPEEDCHWATQECVLGLERRWCPVSPLPWSAVEQCTTDSVVVSTWCSVSISHVLLRKLWKRSEKHTYVHTCTHTRIVTGSLVNMFIPLQTQAHTHIVTGPPANILIPSRQFYGMRAWGKCEPKPNSLQILLAFSFFSF